jgi:hypothetical protein
MPLLFSVKAFIPPRKKPEYEYVHNVLSPDPGNWQQMPVFQQHRYRLVKVLEDGNTRPLTADELTEFEEKHPDQCDWMPAKKMKVSWVDACREVLKVLEKQMFYAWFSVPVDHERLKIPDYPLKITRPMDLGTVRKKLDDGEIEDPEDFVDLVRLVWCNAYVYNPPNSEVRKAAMKLSKKTEECLAALRSTGLVEWPTEKQPWTELNTILRDIVLEMMKDVTISVFFQPVKKETAPDYFDVVSKPIALVNIRDRAEKGRYRARAEFVRDIELIRDNCVAYNGRPAETVSHKFLFPVLIPLSEKLVTMAMDLVNAKDDEIAQAEAIIPKR